ncbi:MAG: GH73 [uncultured Acidimicrobiales bacterium]|uniref:GH73 n=1 Tax=uncultured Acidimicrobiales bacterium TaxID=310071 RepID=A0A6J4IXM1_9ACTN|nr:MAG: GH73 [uncultured Acidimicrobiales bacterium]
MPDNPIASLACSRRGFLAGAATLAATAALPAATAGPASAGTPILGRAQYNAQQIATWYGSVGHGNRATVGVATLAQLFLEEGALEGVRGDIAFCQAMVETGWLTFPTSRMPPGNNNFSGLGAVDGGAGSSAFSTARTGVRAQIQHLKGWAAPIRATQLRTMLVDPRWRYFTATGQIRDWDQLGKGRWASDPNYGTTILAVYGRLTRHAGTPAPPGSVASAPAGSSEPPFPGLVKAGSEGAAVRQVQQRLSDRGWRVPVNGVFDGATDFVVRRFQSEKGLVVDGWVGPRTWTALWRSPVT